ncbi:MAG: hypothetical protein ACPGYV_03070 [Phycisphaeraceae bacterium]
MIHRATPSRPCDNPFNAQRVDAVRYIEYEYALSEVADRLKRTQYRGAIVGPHGCGKTAMLQALGDELMGHGLAPLPLFVNGDRTRGLPSEWRRIVRRARHTDALLLDGYDLLPRWARAWVFCASKRAGGVIVTSHRRVRFATVARPTPSRVVLGRIVDELAPPLRDAIDTDALFDRAGGNLRDALRLAYDQCAG